MLHNRCVEIGKNFNIPIVVKSTFEEMSAGTVVKHEKKLEDLNISGIAKEDNVSKITLLGLDNKVGETYKLFKLLSDNSINVDIIVQSHDEYTSKDVSFSVKTTDLERTLELLNKHLDEVKFKGILNSKNLAKISLVGIGISNTVGVSTRMFEALCKKNIMMHMISTSEIKISVLVDQEQANEAMKAIHRELIETNRRESYV